MILSPTIGNIRRTAIIVDDFLTDPDSVRKFALSREFKADNNYFRGQRSTTVHLWPGMKETLERLLGLRIRNWEKHTTNGVFQFCVGGDQIVYHSDHNTYAAVLYLTPDPPPEAGTTLYRSRKLKGRTVEESCRMQGVACNDNSLFTAALAAQMYEGKLLDPTAWEVVDVIGNRYNRLVIWDAKLVHSASCYFGSTKENGRLFQMFFFDAE